MDATTKAIEATLQVAFEGKHTSDYLRQTIFQLTEALAQIGNMVYEANNRRKNAILAYDSALHHEPVSKVLYVDSNCRIVQQVAWQGDTLVIISHGLLMRYYAAPLRPLEEHEKWEELKVNDRVLLCGHYLLVVEVSGETYIPSTNLDRVDRWDPRQRTRQGQDQPVPLEMVINWLKITGIEAVAGTRRYQDREKAAPVHRTVIR
jgi:hypothetical protein